MLIHERVQQALDGELPLDRLDDGELKLYHQYRQALAAALRPIGELPEVDVAPAVLRAIARPHHQRRQQPEQRRQRGLAAIAAWVWAPRAFTLRPAFGLAAAGLAAFVLISQSARVSPTPPPVVAVEPAASPRMIVEFRLAAPDAHHVSLVGDFNAWRPDHRLRESAPGVWTVSVALEPGVYDYGFMVDGATLRLDPLAPRVADGFGGESSRVAVLPPEVRS